jgi:LPXTG-motif cell wall-anchored protein
MEDVMLLLGLGGGMAGAAWFLRKKGKEDQNQD